MSHDFGVVEVKWLTDDVRGVIQWRRDPMTCINCGLAVYIKANSPNIEAQFLGTVGPFCLNCKDRCLHNESETFTEADVREALACILADDQSGKRYRARRCLRWHLEELTLAALNDYTRRPMFKDGFPA